MLRSFVIAVALIAFGALSDCIASPTKADDATSASETDAYTLGSGDKLKVAIFGEEDLSGEFVVDGGGFIRMPLIGQVKAAGLTVHDFELQVKEKLDAGYLKDARVSVEVINYRPFYIIGEVSRPGEYPYVNDMNLLNAIALAGGYTTRADDSEVYIRRNGSSKEIEYPADQSTKVHPGDIIRVSERYF
jgi:polysaccharide export outer membrane protein